MKFSRLDEEVLQQLSDVQWKVTLELCREIGEERRKQGRREGLVLFIAYIFRNRNTAEELIREPGFASVHVCLEQFEEERWVSSQLRQDPPEVLAQRGGHRRLEWKLTEKGRRARSTMIAAQTTEEAGEVWVPQQT